MEGDRRNVDIGIEMEMEKNPNYSKEKLGLTTTEALEILGRDIRRIVEEYEVDYKRNRYITIAKEKLHRNF